MALVKGKNSYITVEEANEYFADRLDVDAWMSADETQKAQSLVTATTIMDELEWTGMSVDSDQPLAFPRKGRYFDPRAGREMSLDSEIAITRLRVATMELAYHLLNNDGLMDDTGTLSSLKVGEIALAFKSDATSTPPIVRKQISAMLRRGSAGGNMWWRAN